MELDDRDLVHRCLGGDSVSLRNFVDRYQGLLFGLCFRILGHRQDAEDLVQEVFVRAFRSLAHWDAARPLKPWLMKIAVNRCRTELSLRPRRNKAVGFVDELLESNPKWTASSGDVSSDLGEELQLALDGLRNEYRACFVMYHLQELSLEEIAEVMDCPEGTVKTWLFRARRELARQLERRGVGVSG